MANKLKKKSVVQKVIKKTKPMTSSASGSAAAQAKAAPVSTMKLPTGEFAVAVGRRKTATARVRVYKVAGDYIVNDKVVGQYFSGITNGSTLYNLPFVVTDTLGKYAVSAKVTGSGMRAQVDAVCHGIARALIKIDPEFRTLLKKQGLLTRDDRMKETRKMGTGGKARRAKQSPKR